MELVVKLLGSKLGLDEDMRAEHHDGTSALTEEEDARDHCLSAIVDRAKWQPYASQKNGPHQTELASTLILVGLASLQNYEKQSLLFKPSNLWYFAKAAKAKIGV